MSPFAVFSLFTFFLFLLFYILSYIRAHVYVLSRLLNSIFPNVKHFHFTFVCKYTLFFTFLKATQRPKKKGKKLTKKIIHVCMYE